MADTPRAIANLAANIEQSGDVLIMLKAETGGAIKLRMAPGMIAAFAVQMLGIAGRISTSDNDGFSSQPLTLTGIRSALGPDAQPVLALILDGSLQLAVTFPKSAIPAIQNSLATLDVLAAQESPTAKN
jgi:hypothetical protein